jgi:hypothetical protein
LVKRIEPQRHGEHREKVIRTRINAENAEILSNVKNGQIET